MNKSSTEVNILGVRIDPIQKSELYDELDKLIAAKKHSIICTVNTEYIINSIKDSSFKNIINNFSALNVADGVGIVWAADFLQKKFNNFFGKKVIVFCTWIFSILKIPFLSRSKTNVIPERISGADMIWDIAHFAAQKKHKIFLLGGAPTIAERTALTLQSKIIDLKIGGVCSLSSFQSKEILEQINRTNSDILLVAFGSPKQEKWLFENIKKTKCKIGIGLGGTFDYISGTKRRAPIFIQKLGLEWLFRLLSEPSRIIRQLTIPHFMILVLASKLKNDIN